MLYWVHGSPTGHTFEASQRVNNKDKISISLIYYFGTSPNRTIKTNSKVLNVLKAEKITFIKYKFHPQSRWRQSRYFLEVHISLIEIFTGNIRKAFGYKNPGSLNFFYLCFISQTFIRSMLTFKIISSIFVQCTYCKKRFF